MTAWASAPSSIVGIAIGSVVFCACIGVGVFLMMKKTKEAAVTPS